MDIWRIPSTGGTAERLTNYTLEGGLPRLSRRAHAALHGLAAGRFRIGSLRHGHRPANSPRRELRPRGVRLGRGERRRPAPRRDRRESDVASLDGADRGPRRGRLWSRAALRFPPCAPRLRDSGPATSCFCRPKAAPTGSGSSRTARTRSCGRAPTAPSPPRRRSRPTAPGSASWSGAEKQAPPLRDGGGRHGCSRHRRVARCPRFPVLVSGRKVDRRRRLRGQRAAAAQGSRGRWSSRYAWWAGSTTTRSGRPMGGSSRTPNITGDRRTS